MPEVNVPEAKVPAAQSGPARYHDVQVESGMARVTRQFLEAALFEKLLYAVRVDHRRDDNSTFYFSIGREHYRCVGRHRGFDRVRLYLQTLTRVHHSDCEKPREHDWQSLLFAGAHELSPSRRHATRLYREMRQSAFWHDWNATRIPVADVDFSRPLHALEAQLNEGHPYHPCFKARSGFSESDHRQYTPESGHRFRLHWLAVERSKVSGDLLLAESEFWQQELGAYCWQQLQNLLTHLTARPGDYQLMPVHPWQWHHYISCNFQQAILTHQLLYLGPAGDCYTASLSLRTLYNCDQPHKANIKLPLDVVNTSSARFLLSHGVESAAVVSRWLQTVINADAFFQSHRLVILQEYAGLRVREHTLNQHAHEQQCHLGVIFRQSVESRLQQGQQVLPLSGLCAKHPDGTLLLQQMMGDRDPETWLRRFFDVLILPVWHLLVGHGIALETHAQNTLLIHENGWPVALAARDFHESLEYVESFVTRPQLIPDFSDNPCYHNARVNQFYWMDSPEALRELAMDTLFVFHLSELADLCHNHLNFSEDRFWRLVDGVLCDYEKTFPELAPRMATLGYRQPEIQVESLLAARLGRAGSGETSSSECHHQVSNPLAEAALVQSKPSSKPGSKPTTAITSNFENGKQSSC